MRPSELREAVRKFARRKKSKTADACKCCAAMRKELAPVIAALTNILMLSDVVVEDLRQDERDADLREWLAAHARK